MTTAGGPEAEAPAGRRAGAAGGRRSGDPVARGSRGRSGGCEGRAGGTGAGGAAPSGWPGGAGRGLSLRAPLLPPVSRDADPLLGGEGRRAAAATVLTAPSSPHTGSERRRGRPRPRLRHGAAAREARRREPVPAGGGRQRPPRRPGAPRRPHLQREAEGAASLLRYRPAGLIPPVAGGRWLLHHPRPHVRRGGLASRPGLAAAPAGAEL